MPGRASRLFSITYGTSAIGTARQMTIKLIGLTLTLRRIDGRPRCARRTSTFTSCFTSCRRAASSRSPASACSCSTPSRLGLLRKELIETLGVTAARAVLTRFGYAHGWRVAETLRKGFPVGQRRRMAHRRRAASHDSGSRPRGGDARVAQRRRARRRGHLARLVRGRAASAASRPGGRAGVLDAHGLRQRLHVVRVRQGDHRHRGSLPGQRRRGLPRRRPLKGGVGSGTRHAPALLPEGGLPGCQR